MSNWNKISLGQFQQIEAVNARTDIPDMDKVLFTTCIIYNLTEYELDNIKNQSRVLKMINTVNKIFSSPVQQIPAESIDKYKVNYEPETFRFGQYIELSFYISKGYMANAHKIIASITDEKIKRKWVNSSDNHESKAEMFLTKPAIKIIGTLSRFVEKFASFNKKYSWLFGLDPDSHKDGAEGDKFNKTYGWWYAAEAVAGYKRITLDEVYGLNVRDAFSALAYLKAKGKYEAEQLKKK